MKSNSKERSLLRFTGIPEPGSHSVQFGPLVPSQYFKPLFQFIVGKGLLSQKDADLLHKETTSRTRTRTLSSAMKPLLTDKLKKEIGQFMESFLRLPEQYSCTWAEIFHTRLIRSTHTMESVHINSLKLFTFQFIEKCPKELLTNATELLSYINSHNQDIDNSIIGLTPSTYVMDEYNKFTKSIKEKIENVKQKDINCYTKTQILDMIYEWARIESNEQIGIKVKDFVSSLQFQFLHLLSAGDLVVVRVSKNKILKSQSLNLLRKELEIQESSFKIAEENAPESLITSSKIIIGRFCKLEGDKVHVWITADEKKTVTIKMTNICPFSKDLLTMLHSQRTMKRLVEDEIDKMNIVLKDNIRNLVNDYLNENKINLDLLERANSNDVSILDLNELQQTLNTLRKLEDESSERLLQKVEHHINSVINFFEPNISLTRIFHPTRTEILNTFSTWPYVTLASNRIQRYIGVCRSSIDLINEEILTIQNSKLKHSVSEWLLGEIRDRVYLLLTQLNYNFDAVNDNYIENPPKDYELVVKNLQLIREILHDKEGKFNIVEKLILPLKELIYPRLSVFEDKLKTYLMMQTFSPTSNLEEFDVQEYKYALENAKDRFQLPEEVVDVLSSTIMDIEYIEKMKHLEAEFGVSKDTKLSDVVPVSGLTLNYFHRMEMELRTVCEIWDPVRLQKRRTKKGGGSRNSLVSSEPPKNRKSHFSSQKTSPSILSHYTHQSQLKEFVGKLPKPPSLPKDSPRVHIEQPCAPSPSGEGDTFTTPPSSSAVDIKNQFVEPSESSHSNSAPVSSPLRQSHDTNDFSNDNEEEDHLEALLQGYGYDDNDINDVNDYCNNYESIEHREQPSSASINHSDDDDDDENQTVPSEGEEEIKELDHHDDNQEEERSDTPHDDDDDDGGDDPLHTKGDGDNEAPPKFKVPSIVLRTSASSSELPVQSLTVNDVPFRLFSSRLDSDEKEKHKSVLLELANSNNSRKNLMGLEEGKKDLTRCVSVASLSPLEPSKDIDSSNKPGIVRCTSESDISIRTSFRRNAKSKKKRRTQLLKVTRSSSDRNSAE